MGTGFQNGCLAFENVTAEENKKGINVIEENTIPKSTKGATMFNATLFKRKINFFRGIIFLVLFLIQSN